MAPETSEGRLRIAATGDVHCRDSNREAVVASFADLDDDVDLVLIAGDLTSHGRLDEAEILCEAAASAAPVFAGLGNHDWHNDAAETILERLGQGGVQRLDCGAAICQVGEVEVGIVAVKGFVGGFAPRHLSDFGEPSLRAVYAEATAKVQALDEQLREIATWPVRIVLLHSAPIEATLEGSRGRSSSSSAATGWRRRSSSTAPTSSSTAHAHAGSPDGTIGQTLVHNVSQPVLGTDLRIFELDASHAHSPIP